jgi:hypothetical protein
MTPNSAHSPHSPKILPAPRRIPALGASIPRAAAAAAALLAAAALASCAPAYSPPREVQASNPTVTYTYTSNQALLQADQSAATFCSRYQGVARATSFSTDPAGDHVVVFACVPSAPAPDSAAAAPPPGPYAAAQPGAYAAAPAAPAAADPANPNLTYTYLSDQQLMDDQQNARLYCSSLGTPQVTSSTVENADGSRTVTFQCAPQ